MVFYRSRREGLAWWGLAFLAFAIAAGNRGLSTDGVIAGLVILLMALAGVVINRTQRLHMEKEGLSVGRGQGLRQWRWSDISHIQLDYAKRSDRPTLNFEVKGEGRVFLWGPWNVDDTTIYTAMILCHSRWAGAASRREAAGVAGP